MTKENALELIQRDLDNDLSIEEKYQLQALLQNDAGLQLTYNRLKNVSDQLTALPQVVPPFSLVDVILPKLEELPRDPIAVSSTTIQLPKLERKKQEEKLITPKKVPLWVAKVGSGVAAACLLFGMFAIAYPGRDTLDHTQGSMGSKNLETTTSVVPDPKPESPPKVKEKPNNTNSQRPIKPDKNSKNTVATVKPEPNQNPKSDNSRDTVQQKQVVTTQPREKDKDDKIKSNSVVNNPKSKATISANDKSSSKKATSDSNTKNNKNKKDDDEDRVETKKRGKEKDKDDN